jgi:uncharacterized SAM-binding protein YcdF (DUF218 family)
MQTIAEFVKQYLLPGTITFFLVGVLVGVVLLFLDERRRRWGRIWLAALVIGYLLLSLSFTSDLLVAVMSSGYERIETPEKLTGVDAIVILGGGGATFQVGDDHVTTLSESSSLRAIEGARLYELAEDPWVIVSGGTNEQAGLVDPESEPMRELLIELGVPTERILMESASENTHDQALNIPPILNRHAIERFVLLTSPTHIRRATLTFQEAGLDPVPSIAVEKSESLGTDPTLKILNGDALSTSTAFFREILALIWYGLEGWI